MCIDSGGKVVMVTEIYRISDSDTESEIYRIGVNFVSEVGKTTVIRE